MKVRLLDIAEVIRSKNSGPYELTLDLIFREKETFCKVCAAKALTAEKIAKFYGIAVKDILGIIEFEPAKAIKINLKRPIPSGSLGDTDIYGAQQHAPLLNLEFDL